ncbi:MAG TPA: hypothetical protein DCQ99_06955 [Nitrospinae bacterium]|nr:hypothetical protein [Nitrospinota bacterium]
MMDEEDLHKFIDGVPIVTDNNPYVEFTAPRIHHVGTSIKGKNLLNMLKYRKSVKGLVRDLDSNKGEEIEKYFNSYTYFLKGQVGVNDNSLEDAVYSFRKAAEINSENTDARYELINLNINSIYRILSTGEIDKGFELINECIGLDRDNEFTPQLYNLRGLLFLSKKDIKRAVNEFEYAITLDGKYFSPYLNLGSIYTYYEIDLMKAMDYYSRGLGLKITEQERNLINSEIEKIKNISKAGYR